MNGKHTTVSTGFRLKRNLLIAFSEAPLVVVTPEPCCPSVLPDPQQLPPATQAAADGNPSAEQPGGAVPPTELPHPREVQVSSLHIWARSPRAWLWPGCSEVAVKMHTSCELHSSSCEVLKK